MIRHRLRVASNGQLALTMRCIDRAPVKGGVETPEGWSAWLWPPGTFAGELAENDSEAYMLLTHWLVLFERLDGGIIGHWYERESDALAHWRKLNGSEVWEDPRARESSGTEAAGESEAA